MKNALELASAVVFTSLMASIIIYIHQLTNGSDMLFAGDLARAITRTASKFH